MTQRAHCPNCSSALYTPDPSNGGAGRNKCLECSKASPVALWYVADKGVMIVHRKELVSQFPPGTKVAVASCDHNAMPLEPGERRFFAVDEQHFATPLKTDREPAPIRQYKDD